MSILSCLLKLILVILTQWLYLKVDKICLIPSKRNLTSTRSAISIFHFLTLTPSLGLLLLNERTLPSSFNLDMLLEQLSNMLHCASLISLKISYGFLSDSADIPAIYKKLEELLENAFLFPNRTIFSLNLYNEMKKAQEIPSSIFFLRLWQNPRGQNIIFMTITEVN